MEEKLINLVRERKFLYDKTDILYKNIWKREKAWEEIGTILKCDQDLAKKRWRSLRDRYNRDRRKLPDGASPWKYFDLMKFLNDGCYEKETLEETTELVDIENIKEVEEDYSNDISYKLDKTHVDLKELITAAKYSIANKPNDSHISLFFSFLAAKVEAANLPAAINMEIEEETLRIVNMKIKEYQRDGR